MLPVNFQFPSHIRNDCFLILQFIILKTMGWNRC